MATPGTRWAKTPAESPSLSPVSVTCLHPGEGDKRKDAGYSLQGDLGLPCPKSRVQRQKDTGKANHRASEGERRGGRKERETDIEHKRKTEREE